MKRMLSTLPLAASAIALLASAALSAPVPYKIDRSHSEVSFSVRHFFSKTPGRFNEYDGTILLDEKNLQNSTVDVTIQTASVYTANEKRDGHLKTEDFFWAEKHPTITFKSKKVVPSEGKKFKVEGDLTIRGVTKPVVLDAEFLGSGDIAIGGGPTMNRSGFTASTTVNRKDFGIMWNKTLDQGGAMLGDEVTIDLNVEAMKFDPAAAAASKPAAEKAADKTAEKTEDKK